MFALLFHHIILAGHRQQPLNGQEAIKEVWCMRLHKYLIPWIDIRLVKKERTFINKSELHWVGHDTWPLAISMV